MGFEALYDNASVRRRDRLLSAEEAAGVLWRGEYGFLAMQDAGADKPRKGGKRKDAAESAEATEA